MSRLFSGYRLVAAYLATVVASCFDLRAQCALETNIGPSLNLTDDSVSAQQNLGFTFPFAGANYNAVYVSSNGFLYLFDTAGSVQPPTNSMCCDADVMSMLSSTSPMICGLWQDLNPSAGGSVHFVAVPGRAVITWNAVPEYAQNGTSTFQIILYPSGNIEMHMGSCSSVGHISLTGWSPGNNATDPGGSNLSNLPIVASNRTVYEQFNAPNFDLSDLTLLAIPTANGWVVSTPPNCAASSRYGTGCPRPCTFYEIFQQPNFDLTTQSLQFIARAGGGYTVIQCPANCFDTNFSNNLNLTDDSLALNQSLGFSFPYCGGSTTAIDVCSNGFVWMVAGNNNGANYVPTLAEFLADPPRLAPCWMDLNPGAGGAVYFDAVPGKAMVTWNQVPAYGVQGSSNTMQLQLFPNGNIILAWPSVTNNASTNTEVLAGFTPGSGVSDPGAIDLSNVPFVTGSGVPLRLAAQAGSRPVVGNTFTFEMNDVRTGTSGALMSLGTSNPNIDLTPAGLDGCTLYATLQILIPFAPLSPTTTFPLGIPNDPSLVGGTLRSQAIMIDLSIAPVPAYLSNGLRLTLGL